MMSAIALWMVCAVISTISPGRRKKQIEKAAPDTAAKNTALQPCQRWREAKKTTEMTKTSQRGQPNAGRVERSQERKNSSSVNAVDSARMIIKPWPFQPLSWTVYELSAAGNKKLKDTVRVNRIRRTGKSDSTG